ncbi:hypothetical protein X975_06016, partial [Stegodyphus mimosarum]
MDTIKAECHFVRFLIEHNLQISVSDHSKQDSNAVFLESAMAKKFSCSHTKNAAIVEMLAESTVADNVKSVYIQHTLFALSTDGSNDNILLIMMYYVAKRRE